MNSVTPIEAGFNYELVAEDYQGSLMEAAERIKSRVRRQTADIIEIGRDLLSIKAELDHGLFLKWVAAEFRWNPRTAQRYMAAAEWAGEKYDTVSYLPPTLVYALADQTTPDDLKAEVRADLDTGKPVDVKAIKGRIEDARWQRQQAQAQKLNKRHRGKPVSESTRRRREREEAKRIEEAEQRDAERKAAAVEIVEILHRLPEQYFERLLELLDTASLWVVQEMLNRGRS